MLSENAYVNTDSININEVTDDVYIEWVCQECGASVRFSSREIDDYIDSDPHDPLVDYLICGECEEAISIYENKVEVNFDDDSGDTGYLWSDGTFIYVENSRTEEVIRLA